MKILKSMVLAMLLAAMAAATASAATGPAMLKTSGTVGTASNTGATSGNAATYPRHTLGVGAAVMACNDVTFRVTAITTNNTTVDPNIAGCSLLLSGTPVGAATFDTPCDWSLSLANATFVDTTGASTGGTLTTNCTTTVTIPADGCTIHIFAQTREGISAQNITSTGAPTSSPAPWGAAVQLSLSNLTYTASTCPGMAEHGFLQYAGQVAVRNLWGSL